MTSRMSRPARNASYGGGGRSIDSSTEISETMDTDDQSHSLLGEDSEDRTIPVDNIHVQAPSDLPGGYQMEVEVKGQPGPVLITVPKGGVQEGDFFTPSSATLLSDVHLSVRGIRRPPNSNGGIPIGDWRDSFWDLCKLGPCHPTVWNSCCCPLLAAAQVITRLQLTWYGTPGSNIAQVAIAFQVLVMILVAYWFMRIFVFLIIAYLDPNADPNTVVYLDPPPTYYFFAALDDMLFYIYLALVVIILRNVRSHLRQKYAIPESESNCTPGCEDVCCSLVCPCFTVAQMMRHTADYEVHTATCCSRTGLGKDGPGIV